MTFRKICFPVIAALFFPAFIWSSSFAQQAPFKGEVNSNGINVRCDSTAGSEIICQVDKGARVDVISESYGWLKIRLPRQSPSYVKKELIECMSYENIPVSSGGHIITEPNKRCLSAKAAKDRINVRLKPSESSAVLGKLEINEVVTILKESDGWYKIEPIANSFGWINKKFISEAPLEPKTLPKKKKSGWWN